MHLFLRCNETHPVEVGAVKVSDLKPLFEAAENIPADQLTLYYAATVGLLGGKVHGSLARAGKVKGQTPKVEKQEKKKKKTGRAKRRMQFNRRFVNVVVTFGRKKGPNSNS
ncbi:40S ribosomal protein S30 [Caerostris darwini]|uniref:40S ribosomal protein S30 n=1 Tax=Caerostris darwini TaxID=1538125 RepID=A0AAV4S2J8_9ARAC|nr:40S ribosomal protein S30 [Caerostris darwini]